MSISITTQPKSSADHKTAAGKQEKKNSPDQFQDMEKPLFSPVIQTKLTTGQPGDHYEQEANVMAERVVQKFNLPIQNKTTSSEKVSTIQLKTEEEKDYSKGVKKFIAHLENGDEDLAISHLSTINSKDKDTILKDRDKIFNLALKKFNNKEMFLAVSAMNQNLFSSLVWLLQEGTNWERVRALLTQINDPKARKRIMENDWMRRKFTKVCNNKEMAEAVDLLGGTLTQKLTWMYEEGKNGAAVLIKIQGSSSSEKLDVLNSPALMKKIRKNSRYSRKIVKALISAVSLPAGKIEDAVVELAISTMPVDRNTATKILNGVIDPMYIDTLSHPPNETDMLRNDGRSSSEWTYYVNPVTGNNILVQLNSAGFANGNQIFGWKRLSVDRWKMLLVHETNHVLNNDNSSLSDSFQRYEGEFRAYWISEYRDQGLNDRAKAIKKHILSDYPSFLKRYDSDPAFKAKVDAHTKPTGNITNQ